MVKLTRLRNHIEESATELSKAVLADEMNALDYVVRTPGIFPGYPNQDIVDTGLLRRSFVGRSVKSARMKHLLTVWNTAMSKDGFRYPSYVRRHGRNGGRDFYQAAKVKLRKLLKARLSKNA